MVHEDAESGIFCSMMRTLVGIVSAFFLTCVGPAALGAWDRELADEAAEILDGADSFAAAIVQHDRIHPVDGRAIRLEPEPFAIVIVMHEPDGVLVNASPEPDFYDGIRAGRSLDEILDEPDMFMGMAEYFFNPDRELFVSEVFPHYVFFNAFDQHRYDFVHLTPNRVIGYRSVAYLYDLDGETGRHPIAEWGSPLYLSFYYTIFDEGERVEIQNATTKIEFN